MVAWVKEIRTSSQSIMKEMKEGRMSQREPGKGSGGSHLREGY